MKKIIKKPTCKICYMKIKNKQSLGNFTKINIKMQNKMSQHQKV